MDFLLPEIEAVVEIKMSRPTITTRQLGEQLIVDITKYKNHTACRTLLTLVYDPGGRISKPGGVETDLREESDRMTTHAKPVWTSTRRRAGKSNLARKFVGM
jgi:hypothetical protein